MAKNGICVNVGNCDNANQKKVLEIGTGQDFVCPQCGKSLVIYAPQKGKSLALLAVVAVVLLVLLVVAWRMFAGSKEAAPAAAPPVTAQPNPEPQATVPPPAPAAPPAATPVAPENTPPRLPPCGANDDERRRLKLCD